jgi:myxalamid-type polyketide synthase MxaE and MxaD
LESNSPFTATAEPIAIVGIGCRFPKSEGLDGFWQSLVDGVDAITEIPSSRFPASVLYDPRPAIPGRISTRWGGILEGIDLFDAEFFGISPREAAWLDPQQRLLLETTWEALETAGQVPARLRGSNTGVFVGMWLNEYESRMFRDLPRIDFYMTTGTGRYAASGRLSNLFGWHGPSLTVDCACSSSLVALHLACRSLRSGECDLAVAGAANVLLEPNITVAYSQSRMMAPDGRCKFGDARANGYVRSEGAGVLVLKRLSRALAEGDPIVSLILGSAVNNDGASGGSFGTPGKDGQIDLLHKAWHDAGITSADIDYVEAHGTGTRAGDPVEIAAIAAALGDGRPPDQRVLIGSVKTNIGHTESAAGVAGVIKTALALQHNVIPRNLHFETPNPDIPWDRLPVEIPREARQWPDRGRPGIAGVSSFGISGTNAHVVLQRYEPQPMAAISGSAASARQELVVLSARSQEALRDLATRWLQWLGGPGGTVSVHDIGFTSALRRDHHEYRLAIVAETVQEVRERLSAFLAAEPSRGVAHGKREANGPLKAVFACPGQGSQWVGMGRRLYEQEPVFRQTVNRCDESIARLAGGSLRETIFARSDAAWLDEIAVVQPALFAMQIALADLWRSWGVEPAAVVGHSMGEVAAAFICGALELDAAVRVICARSRLMKRMSGRGAMALVELSLQDAQHALSAYEGRVSVAVNNSRSSTVISGDPQAIEEILAELETKEIFCRRIKVDVASHSPQMESVKGELVASLGALNARPAQLPMVSTVTGDFVCGDELDPEYWGRNLREPVLFASAVDRLSRDGYRVFLELSPHPVITTAIQQQLGGDSPAASAWPSLRREEDDRFVMLETLAGLYSMGFDPDWTRLFPANRPVVALPVYPWQRERHWYDPRKSKTIGYAGSNRVGLGQKLDVATDNGTHIWEAGLDRGAHATYWEHRVGGVATLSAASSLRLVLEAAREMFGRSAAFLFEDVQFVAPIALPDDGDSPALQLALAREGRAAAFRLHSRSNGVWTAGVSGRVSALSRCAASEAGKLEPVEHHGPDWTQGSLEYAALAHAGVEIGSPLQVIDSLLRKDGTAWANLRQAGESDPLAELMEGAFHLTSMMGRHEGNGASCDLFVPVHVGSILLHDGMSPAATVRVQCRYAGEEIEADVDVVDACGLQIAEFRQTKAVKISSRRAGVLPARELLYEVAWKPEPISQPSGSNPEVSERVWVVFVDKSGVGEALGAAIARDGGPVVLVERGREWRQDGNRFQIRPDAADDMGRLLDACASQHGGASRGLIYLWGVDSVSDAPSSVTSLEHMHAAQCDPLLHLLRHAARASWTNPPRLWIVTSGAQPVGDAAVNAVPAALWGLGRVVAAEHPELWGGLIDIAAEAEESAFAVWQEVRFGAVGEHAAWRGPNRYVARLERWARSSSIDPVRFRTDATYLITGGLGALGFEIVRWMVTRGARHFLLMGRTVLPPREQWSGLLPHAIAQRVARIRRLEAVGASVYPASLDVADGDVLAECLQRFRCEGRPPIRGVVHAAATIDDRLLLDLDTRSWHEVFHAKAAGALHLHEAFAKEDLDHFVLFSSLGSLLGQEGQASYAAANAVLDALAHSRRASGLPAMSLSWGPWSGLGFAQTAGGAQVIARLAQQGIDTLSSTQATESLALALESGATHALIAPIDWNRFAESTSHAGRVPLTRTFVDAVMSKPEVVGKSVTKSFHDQLAQLPQAERLASLCSQLKDQLAQVLRVAPARIDEHKPLGTLGLTSLLGLEFRARLEKMLAVPLPATLIWNYPTLSKLADHLLSRLGLAESAEEKHGQKIEPDVSPSPEPLADLETMSDADALLSLRGAGRR